MASKEKITPLMRQYFAIKELHNDAILLFQVGDFYEIFFDDAKVASSFLAIALTSRGKHKGEKIPLCGVPIHAINHYLVKLIKGGFKVALCDQTSKPQPGKVVERAVTQVFTPGTLTDEQMLDEKKPSYLLTLYPGPKNWGLAFTELLTGQVFATVLPKDSYRMLESELIRFFPDEIVLPRTERTNKLKKILCGQGFSISDVPLGEGEDFSLWAEKQFNAAVFKQLHQEDSVKHSINLLYCYLKQNQERALSLLDSVRFYKPDDFLILDSSTQKNLELTKNMNDGSRHNSLFSVVDRSVTSMGSRTIKKWIQRPLVNRSAILQRQEVVVALSQNIEAMRKLEELFGQVADLERIVGRIALQRSLLRDYLALKTSLKIVPKIKQVLEQHLLFYLTDIVQSKLRDFSSLVQLLDCALNDDSEKKWLIKKGFDPQLDRLRVLVEDSQKEILKLEQKEISRTGISSLKIRFNNIAGYYIEVTKPNLSLVPSDYIQQQTLVNRNRYVTSELKDLERDIFKAKNEIEQVEQEAFSRVKREVLEQLSWLRQLAQALAYLDGLLGFARVSYERNYVAPVFSETGRDIVIKQGRHPVVETVLKSSFIANDTSLTDNESLYILTGPNMGGKSTYLRQVATLCIMAQAGCLIPVETANLPVLDRVFTRIGSGDNLSGGKSTFLVEMEEAAVICNQATDRSLVILDEVGRGTSTFDGMALAQAIIEYIAEKIKARCLFATHYHELTSLKDKFPGIENYHVACQKKEDGILFLHKVQKGVAAGSFGIEVAKLAKLPASVIERAKKILWNQKPVVQVRPADSGVANGDLLALKSELEKFEKVLSHVKKVSLEDLTPREAFDIVWRMKEAL